MSESTTLVHRVIGKKEMQTEISDVQSELDECMYHTGTPSYALMTPKFQKDCPVKHESKCAGSSKVLNVCTNPLARFETVTD